MSNMKIGIDIGGSHIGIGLVKNGSIILKEEKFIVEKNNAKELIELFIIETVLDMMAEHEIESIGIAVPGTISENKIIKSVNLDLENYDLVGKLKEKLDLNIKLKNIQHLNIKPWRNLCNSIKITMNGRKR